MSVPGPIRLEVPDLVDAVPGGPFEFEVRLTHEAAHDTSVLVRVVGALVGLEPARVVDLPAGQPVTTSVRLALPDGMSPGRHLVVVEVVERTVGQVVEATEVAVAIARTSGVSITMTPATVSKRRQGSFRAMVRNHDDVEQRLRLKPAADRPGLALAVAPEELVLGPGESRTVAGRLKMKGFWLGQLRERWFTLSGESSGASVYGRGLILQKPLIGKSITKLVGLVAILAVWLAGTLVVMRLLDPVTDDAATGADAAVDAGPTKPTIPFGDGETRETITVSGTVTAQPDGSGVSVLYRPVTLADTSTAEGKASPGVGDTDVAGLRTETNADGQFEVAGLDANGIFEFRFAKAGHNTLTRLVQPNGADAVVEVALEVGSGVISGIVVGPLGGPRGGVIVTLSDGAITYTTSTPSSGDNASQFVFNNLSTPGTYVLDARATGFGLASTIIELGSGGVRQDVVIEISPDIGVLSGRVNSSSFETLASAAKAPAKGISITATDGTITRSTSTLSEGDLAGTFRLVGLPLNRTYTVTFEGQGWATRTELVDFGPDFEPLDVSLIPSTGRVRGTITTPPDTVSPAAIAVTLDSPDRTYKSTDAISADGDLLFTNIDPGTYVAVFQAIGLVDQVREVTVSAGQTSVLNVDMKAPSVGLGVGTINATVIDSASLEPMNATVTMRFRSSNCGTVAGVAAGTCRWNVSGGALTITDLEAGAYYLEFTAEGYRPDVVIVEAIPAQTVPVAMQLAPLGSVQGIVIDSEGGSLQGANLVLYEANADDTPGALVARTQVNATGEYKFSRVMFARNYVLSATLSGFNSVARPITGAVASTINLDLTLRSQAQLTGEVRRLNVLTGEITPVGISEFTVFLRTGTASAWVDMLPNGLVRTLGGYRLAVAPNAADGVTTSASAVYALCIQRSPDGTFSPDKCGAPGVSPDEAQVFDEGGAGIEIRLDELKVNSVVFTPNPASISGLAKSPDGQPLPEGVTVELRRVDLDNRVVETFTALTTAGGRFDFSNLAPTTQEPGFAPLDASPGAGAQAASSASSYRIQIRADVGSYLSPKFDLGPLAGYNMDVTLLRGSGDLEIVVVDDAGEPIRNALVYVMATTTSAQALTANPAQPNLNFSQTLCGALPAPGGDRVATRCTDDGGSVLFERLSAPVRYQVVIGRADSAGFVEVLPQIVPVRVPFDGNESRTLRVSWFYGDAKVEVAALDPTRVTTASLSALSQAVSPSVTVTAVRLSAAGNVAVPELGNEACRVAATEVGATPTAAVGLNATGECYFSNLRPGTYRITTAISDPDTQKILQSVTSANVVVQPGKFTSVVPITIPIIQRTLDVRVLNSFTNATIAGATVVVARPGDAQNFVKSPEADGVARFSTDDNTLPDPGLILVSVGAPGFATSSATVTIRQGENQTLTVALASSITQARVAVFDTAGLPVTGATVTVGGELATPDACVTEPEESKKPGWYCLGEAAAGLVDVVVTKAGFQTVTVPMAIANPGGGAVTVILGASTGSLVVDAVDAATGAAVSLDTWSVSVVGQNPPSTSAGSVSFTDVVPGVVAVALVPPAGSPYAPVTISASVVAGVSLSATARLNRVSEGLVITVVDSLGNAVSGANVSAGTSGTLDPCPGGVANRYCWTAATPGVVSVSATKDGYTSVLLYTTVDGNGTGSITLVLRKLTGNLLVNVVDASTGQPVTALTSGNVTISSSTPPCVDGLAGQCEFTGLVSGGYTVVVSGVAGYEAATLSALVPLDGRTGVVNVALRPTAGSLVVDAVDAATGAAVSLDAWSVSVVGQNPSSLSAGSVSFTGVVPGVVAVVLVPPVGSPYAAVTVSASVVAGVSLSVTARLNRVSEGLVVTVVDSLGATVSGAAVTVSGTTPLDVCADGPANRFCGVGVTPGVVSVSASAPGYTSVSLLTTVNGNGTGSITLVLRKLTGNLLVNVVDASTGQPVTALTSGNVTISSSTPPCVTTGLSAGQCLFEGLDSTGLFTVTVNMDGFVVTTVSAGVPLDGLTGSVTVALLPIAGSLVVDAVDAATGAAVSLDTWSVSVVGQNPPSTSAGSVSFTDVVPGVVAVALVPPAGSPYAPVTISASVVAGVSLSVTARLNRVSEGLVVTVVDSLGATVSGAAVTVGTSGVLALCDGSTDRYCLTSATPGVVTVSASAPGFATMSMLATVQGDGTGSITLVLRRSTGDLLVTVTDAVTGQPVVIDSSKVTVSAVGALPCDTTGLSAGQCRFKGLNPGSVTVVVSGVANYADATLSASVPLDGLAGTVNVALNPLTTPAPFRVRVLDDSGAVISGASSPTVSASVNGTSIPLTACGEEWCADTLLRGIAVVTGSATSYTRVEVLTAITNDGGAITLVLRKTLGNLLVSLIDDTTGAPIDIVAPGDVTVSATVAPCAPFDTGRCLFSDVPSGVVTVSATGFTGYQQATVPAGVLLGGQTSVVTIRLLPVVANGGLELVVSEAATGQAVTTAAVTASKGAETKNATDSASATGRYSFSDLDSGVWTVTVSASGFVDRVLSLEVRAGVVGQFVVDLAQGRYAITGVVFDVVAQSHVVGARVTVTGSALNTAREVFTDALGRYSVVGLEVGEYTVSVSASGYAPTTGATTPWAPSVSSEATVTVDGVSDVVQDLALAALPGSIAFTIRAPSGAPIDAITVWVDVNRNGERDAGEVHTTDNNGSVTVADIPAGVYDVVLSDDASRYATTSALVLVERNRQTAVTFRMGTWGATVTVAVEIVPVAGLGGSPADVEVQLTRTDTNATLSKSTVSNGALALATFDQVPSGTYSLQFKGDEGDFVGSGGTVTVSGVPYVVPTLQPITVGELGFDVSAGMVSLARLNVDVTVVVVDAEGVGVAGAQISVAGDSLLTPRTAFTTSTSGQAQAVLSLPAHATLSATAALANYGSASAELITQSSSITITLTLAAGVATLTVVPVDAASPSTVLPIQTLKIERLSTGDVTTSAAATYTQSGFAPGGYRVTVSAEGYVDYVTTLTLAAGENRTLTAPMSVIGATTGSVTINAIDAASPGTSLTPTAVTLTNLADGLPDTTTSGFTYTNLTPGSYRVSVSATGFVDYVTTFALEAGQALVVTANMTSNAPGGVVVSLRSTYGATVAADASAIFLLDAAGASTGVCSVDTVDPSRCAFTNVPAGPYSVTISAAGYFGFESISVVAGVTTSATVVVNFTRTVTFTVTLSGSTVPGATVSVDETGLSCLTDDDGKCSITGLDPAMTYTVRATNGTNQGVEGLVPEATTLEIGLDPGT